MKLSVKDLINVGLFSVIYFIMFTISGILGYIPICVVILPLIAGILGGTDAYINAVMKLTPNYMILVVIVLALVGGMLGACLEKSVLKKHFEKAGIA